MNKLEAGEYLLKNDGESLIILAEHNFKMKLLDFNNKIAPSLKDSRLEVEDDSDEEMCLKIEENEIDEFRIKDKIESINKSDKKFFFFFNMII